MLDVHPPHAPTHTWKDFFIHIATIVIGLLIAVGLEQTVEVIHHRELAAHARESLAEEMSANHTLVQQERYTLVMHEEYLFRDLVAIGHIRRHALAPDDRMVLFHPNVQLQKSAWQTTMESGAVVFFSYDETQRYAALYDWQDDFAATAEGSVTSLQRAQTIFYQSAADRFDPEKARLAAPPNAHFGTSGDAAAHAAFEDQAHQGEQLARLTPAEVDRLEQTVQQAIYEDEKLINRCDWLSSRYKAFGK